MITIYQNLAYNYDHPKGGIHGNSILIKTILQTEAIQIEGTESLCVTWILLKNYNFILGAVYMPPSNSEYYNDDLFDDFIDDMSYITSIYDKPFVVIGDSRTAMIDDYFEDDELCDHNMTNIDLFDNVIEFDSSVNHDNIILNDRVKKDLIINSNGRKLIELCQVLDVNIVNRRVGKDSTIGEYTCHRYNGKSAIDRVRTPPGNLEYSWIFIWNFSGPGKPGEIMLFFEI